MAIVLLAKFIVLELCNYASVTIQNPNTGVYAAPETSYAAYIRDGTVLN